MSAIALLPVAVASAGQPVPSTIRLSIRDCYPPSLSAVDTFSALSLELKQDGAHRVLLTSSSQAAVDAELDVTVSCDPKVEATIVLVAVKTARERSRAVRLDDVKPKDRPRALALVAAEFVRREWSGLDVAQVAPSRAPQASGQTETKQSEVRPPEPPNNKERAQSSSEPSPRSQPPSASRSDESPREPTTAGTAAAPAVVGSSVSDAEPRREASPAGGLAISAFGAARWFTDYGSLLLGGGAGIDFDRAAFHIEALTSGQATHLGAASTSLVAATASWKPWQWDAGPMRFALAATGSLGITWATATPDRDTVTAQNAQALYADLRLSAKTGTLLGPIWLWGGLEGGRAAGMASFAEGEVAGATGGWFVGLTLGAALPLAVPGREKKLAQ